MSSDGESAPVGERELSILVCLLLLLVLVFALVPDDIAEQMFWIATGWFVLFSFLAKVIALRMRFIAYAVVSVIIAMVIRII